MENHGQERGYPYLAGEDGEYVKRIVLVEKNKLAHVTIQSVYDLVPSEFHKNTFGCFHKKRRSWTSSSPSTVEQRDHGLHSYMGKMYNETFGLRGRRRSHRADDSSSQSAQVHEKSYEINNYPEQIGDCWVMTCHFDGLNKNGQPFNMKERVII